MKDEHKELIHDYLHISKKTKRIEERLHKAEVEFYSQNLCGGTDFYDPLGVKNKGFNIESKVINYLDFVERCKQNIKKNKRRQYYFNLFTYTLDLQTYSSLKYRYGDINSLDDLEVYGHDKIVLDEILEIEEAISHEFDFNQFDESEKAMLMVEYNNLEPDTLEGSFEAMLNVLGVG